MGFDNECIPNIQYLAGEYFCPVCRMLVYPNEAIQSQCTHLYCKPCLMYVISTTRACPYDGYLVTQEDSKPLLESNKTLAETIGKIVVRCLYHRSGCTWQGTLSDCPSHCSACAFGNSPVVCNRCAIQIVHRQVQEHAQTCPGVQSQAQPGEGFLTSTASTITNQMQVSVHGATASSQAQASHIAAAVVPGKVPSQAAISNPDFPPVAQAAQPVSDLSLQQQHYPQYAGYDSYLQHYQQYHQQHGVQQYQEQQIQNPPLRPQLQVHSLPTPAAQPHTQGQILSQQQPQAVLHTEPPALPMPLAQNHPQSQAIAAGQQQPHPMIHPQSHIHSQSHSLARPPLLNQPQLHPHAPPHSQLHPQQVSIPHQQNQAQAQARIHLHAHSSVQPQQVHSQTYPSQTNYLTQYRPVHTTPGHHSYSLQSQSGITQQPGLHSYLQGDLQQQQQQRAVPVQSQVSQQIMNPTQILGLNQQRPSVLPSSNEHQIVPTGQQQNFAQQLDFMMHHHPSVQVIGQPSAPQYQQQQVPVTVLTPMHSQLRTYVPPVMPRQFGAVMQPQQNVAFPHSELPYQSQSQVGRTRVQLQEYPVTNGGVNQKSLTPGGSGQHSDTQIRSDSHPQTVAEQQSTYLQPVVRAQSDPNYMSAENSAARVRLEGRETPTVDDKSSEAFPSTSASRTGAPSNEKGLKDERMNHSEELISVGGSGSDANDFKEGDPNKVESEIMDPQSNLSANGTDERFSTVALVSEKYESKASVEGRMSDSKLRLVHQSHNPPEVPQSNINQTSLNHGLTQQTSQLTSVSGLQPGKVTDHSLRDPSDVRQPSGNHGTQFRRVTGVPSEPETSLIPSSVVHSAPSNHMPPLVSQSTGPFPPVLDPDGRLTVKASPYAFEERTSMSTGLSANSRSSFDGNQPYFHHSVSGSSANPTTASLKSGPNWLNAAGWHDERFRAPQDKIPQEEGSQRVFKEDLMQFPRLPAMVSEHFRKQGQIFSSMPYVRDSFGFNMIPRPLDKALYGLCHDEHVQPGTFPEDNRPDLRRDFRSTPSMYGHHLRVPLSGSNIEHPNMSAHTVGYGDSRADFRLGIDGKDHNLFAPVKPFNLSSQSAELSFINSKSLNLPPHLHRGSYSGQAYNAELAGHGSIPPPPSGIGFRSNFLPTENRPYVSDLELSDNLRKRNTVNMGWCRICKVDCETVEGLDLHSQTREHQRMSMDMVLKIKQQNSKRQKLISND
uniref:RING-type domain-containing protein n=1 Tax=Kalanchoe fedtschenkoi TaxID=63787 RepID=A0A7N0ULX6_KALFE